MVEMGIEKSTVMEEQREHGTVFAEKGQRYFRAQTVFCVVIMCMGSLSWAYAGGVIGNTLGQPSFYQYMGLDKDKNATALLGATTSLYYAGGVFGAFLSSWIADRWGRKRSLYAGGIIVVVAAALCAGSVNIAMFIVFRFAGGLGAFMMFMAVPLWITECVPPEVRGAFAQCHAVALTLGYLIASYVGVAFFMHISPNSMAAWRGPQAIGAIPPILLLCGLWWVPESPRFLLTKGREAEAWEIVRRLNSRTRDTEHRFAEIEMFQMRKQIELDRTLPSSWFHMFTRPSFRKRMLMTVFMGFSLLSTGNLTLVIYATVIYGNLGFDPLKQQLLQAGIFAAAMPAVFGAIFFTERFRRPTLVTIGQGSMTAVLSCYTAVTAHFSGQPDNKSAQIASVALIYIFLVISSGFNEGPLNYWSAELYPTHLRAKGQTLQATTFAAVSILWAQSAPTAIANIGWKFFLVFICITVFTTLTIYFFFPDTQGKSLEEVALLFGDDDLVVILQQDIQIDDVRHEISGRAHLDSEGKAIVERLETVE